MDRTKFLPNKDLEKKNACSKTFVCTQCGECCHIRENKNIDHVEEKNYHNYMFKHFGIIYLAKLTDITINISPNEKKVLDKIAKEKDITLNIKPKRAVYDQKNHQLIIIDYFIDHDICPFFDKKHKSCTVYNFRPYICRSYPLTSTKSYGKCIFKKLDYSAYGEELLYAKKLEDIITKQKSILRKMIDSNEIIIPKTISEEELSHILRTAKISELIIE